MNSLRKNCSSVKEKEENQHLQPQPQPPAVIPLLQQEQPFFYNHHRGGARPINCGERLSNQKEDGWMMVEREHMFDKVVTPSDVGKLNRLVIPKQHAERYFPLDSSTNYKGLLLNFEDSDGKLWRFQYSYWNSSQSYVMTKGWSRFVKEKKLDAGDVVSFQRGVGVTAKDRLFIDWRRRVNPSSPPPDHLSFVFHNRNLIHNYSPLVLQSLPAWRNPNRNPNFMLQAPYMNPNVPNSSRSVYFGPGLGLGLGLGFDPPQQQLKLDLPAPPAAASAKVVSGKRLRLFGVNMDCEFSEDEDDRYYDHPGEPNRPNHPIPSSSSYSIPTIPYLPLTPFERETECSKISMLSTSSAHDFNIIANSTASGVSLDLKM